jgi:thiol-disulfide isomerase/thioredoxin
MKIKLFAFLSAASLLLSGQRGFTAETSDAAAELKDLIVKIQAGMKEGKKTEAALADELKAFDTLLAKHKGEKTDEVANILFMEAMLYLQVFDDTDKGVALIQRVKREFPDTKSGKGADQMLESIKKQEEGKKIQRSLSPGSKFPDFDEKDVAGKPLSIANYKGKVVLIDFWATWCGPCVHELPNVIKVYEKQHAKGFEIIGISLDQDESKLTNYTKEKNMPWQQFFDGKGWGNKLAAKYAYSSLSSVFPVLNDSRHRHWILAILVSLNGRR